MKDTCHTLIIGGDCGGVAVSESLHGTARQDRMFFESVVNLLENIASMPKIPCIINEF